MMRTDELVELLATGAEPADPRAAQRRFAAAAGWGAFGAVLLMAIFLGVRPDLRSAAALPMFWVKIGFVLVLAAFALPINLRLGRPGARLGRLPWGLATPILLVWILAIASLLGAAPGERDALIFGQTWRSCPLLVAGLSLPSFAGALWAMKGLAPTRLRLAGAAAGALAAGIGASAYALHCPELGAPFLAVWYVIGLLIPVAVGALIGPRVLRW
jgi:hypothetical protein